MDGGTEPERSFCMVSSGKLASSGIGECTLPAFSLLLVVSCKLKVVVLHIDEGRMLQLSTLTLE